MMRNIDKVQIVARALCEIKEQVVNAKLIDYLKKQFSNLLNNNNIKEIILSALPYNAEEENVNTILILMKKI